MAKPVKLSIVGGIDYTPQSQTEQPRKVSCRPLVGPPAALSSTGKNKQLRKQRAEFWRAADATVNYWQARMRFEDAIEIARHCGAPAASRHPEKTPEDRMPLLKHYRAALAEQLLTPAPNIASVNWKQAVVDGDGYVFVECVKKEQVEKAIADDLAFLAAHPARRARSNLP
jgi:hypothetical protein